MTEQGRGRPLPSTIMVQGLPVRPGDPVILLFEDESVLRVYEGTDAQTGEIFLKIEDEWTTDPRQVGGPWRLESLRHPDILGGFIREVDAGR